MEQLVQSILWRQLDAPGHDGCCLWSLPDGWRLSGTAVFSSNDQPCHLAYEVECDHSWHTRTATVNGFIGETVVALTIERLPDARWLFNGTEQPHAAGLADLDLGFTPATNVLQLRRLSLNIGQMSEAPVAYLHFPALALDRLDQRYHRTSTHEYHYRSPTFAYDALLQVTDHGFITQYPALWTVEAATG